MSDDVETYSSIVDFRETTASAMDDLADLMGKAPRPFGQSERPMLPHFRSFQDTLWGAVDHGASLAAKVLFDGVSLPIDTVRWPPAIGLPNLGSRGLTDLLVRIDPRSRKIDIHPSGSPLSCD